MKIFSPVKQGSIHTDQHGRVVGYCVTVKGPSQVETMAKAAADAMAHHYPNRNSARWLDSIINREEYGKMITFTFAEL